MQDGKTDLTLLKSKKYSFKQCRGDEHKKSRNSKFLKKKWALEFPLFKNVVGKSEHKRQWQKNYPAIQKIHYYTRRISYELYNVQ